MTDVKDSTLTVVHIISGLGQGGAETVLYRLLQSSGPLLRHIVVSLTDEGIYGERLREMGVPVHVVSFRGLTGPVTGLWRLRQLLRQLQPNVVQTWMYHADLFGGLAARLAGCRHVAWGIRNSGADLHHASRSALLAARLCASLSGRVPQAIVACAHDAAQRHREWGYRADRMLVIPNGYDLSRWQADPAARGPVRQEWGVDADELVLGFVARWNPLKDHENLFAALALLRQRGARPRCVLVGPGMQEENAELRQVLERHGVRDQVMLLGPRDDVPRLVNGLDFHVLSSRAEGFPNVVAETMAAGVPAVVTDAGDARFIVGETGWVVPVRQPPALADALASALACLGTPDYVRRAQAARLRVQECFSLQAMTSAYEGLWRTMMRDAHPVAGDRVQSASSAQPVESVPSATPPGARRRLLFVVNNPDFLVSHRLPVARAALEAGFDVHVASPDGPAVATLAGLGMSHHVIPLSRSGRHPLQELQSMWHMWRLFRELKPDIMHAVTIKPVLYGGMAARLARVPATVSAVSGLGYVFMHSSGAGRWVRRAATLMYRQALGHPRSRVIFQNTSDRDVLREAGVLREGQDVLIRGSGVDLSAFPFVPEPSGAVVAVMVARLLADKGVHEFVEAARLSRAAGADIRWVLVGEPDPGNPASVSVQQVRAWHEEGLVEWLGERKDIAQVYADAHIAVLPSYREGLPKSLIEAAACGRAVVTTDVPGCRDAITPGETGLLVPVRDAQALAQAVMQLATDASRRQAMGAAGRQLAEQAFDVRGVASEHLKIYYDLLRTR